MESDNINMEISSVKIEPLELQIDIKTEMDNDESDPLSTELPNNDCDSGVNDTWATYKWVCSQCYVDYKTVEELRYHAKEEHNMCNAFACFDCKKKYSLFDDFIEHIRGHRNALRSHCQYCKESFKSEELCEQHVKNHLKQKICVLCGEMLPYASSLDIHKQLYWQSLSADRKIEEKSWDDYTWICQICSRVYPGSEWLRAHVQAAHDRCFAFSCADCPRRTDNYDQFVAHVADHRPYLKKYCHYCNACFPTAGQMSRHVLSHIAGSLRPCRACGQVFEDHMMLAKHRDTFSGPDLEKPAETKKRGNYRKKAPPTIDDLTCKVCLKIFASKRKLTIHSRTHESRTKDYICPICNKAFQYKRTMEAHAITHNAVKTETCLVCNKKFHTKRRLKAHILIHSNIKPYICDECGASFKSKRAVQRHLTTHSNKKTFKCSQCDKCFKYKENLITHTHEHTGVKNYSCEVCEKQFSTWIHCNNHMTRKHGVKFAKNKEKTIGEVNPLEMDDKTSAWLDDMLKNQKRRKESNEANV